MNEYWIVKERNTGKVIAHCGDINDAIMMSEMDANNRSYSRHRFLSDQVIDVSFTTDKQLPGQHGLPSGNTYSFNPTLIRLNEGQGKPVIV